MKPRRTEIRSGRELQDNTAKTIEQVRRLHSSSEVSSTDYSEVAWDPISLKPPPLEKGESLCNGR